MYDCTTNEKPVIFEYAGFYIAMTIALYFTIVLYTYYIRC